MSHNFTLKNNKRIRLKRKRMIIKAAAVMGVVFFAFAMLAWGAHNERIRITRISIEGNSVVLDKDIKKEAEKILSGKYLWIFPKDNIFLYPKRQIVKGIMNAFKRIYYVNVSTIDMNSVKISVKERYPFALWCGSSLDDGSRNISDECYFLDKTGFVFAQSPNFSDDVYFEFYGVLKGSVIGKQFLSSKEFARIISFKELLNNNNLTVDKLLVKENGDYVFHMNNSNKTTIVFNKMQDFEKIFYNLKSAIETKIAQGDRKDIFKNLKYIDLRFDNKVLFKY